jgi:aryl-alcohol dehydrogenase-like predicted oxidoreductase
VSLPKRPLGTSGMDITTIGFGTWALGGSGWFFNLGPQPDANSVATMRHAMDLGINWVDTAAVYGLGHSEEVVGKFLREVSPAQRPFVFTKVGMVWDPANRAKEPQRNLRPESIRRECEASLRRLGIDRIDLYQCHWPDQSGTAVEDSWATMLRLAEEGKIRAAGVSNFGADLLQRCEGLGHVQSCQPPFSPINRQAASDEIPWCLNHRTGVIVYSPLQSGLLTERFSSLASLDRNDWRHNAPEFQQPKLGRNLALRDSLAAIARRHAASVSAVAIAWVLAWPGVTAAMAGARTPAQVDGWIQAASLHLSSEDMAEIAAAIQATGAGNGPVQPPEKLAGAPAT